MQTSYELNRAAAFAGMIADARYTEKESFNAGEEIPFGRGVGGDTGNYDKVYLPKNDTITLTLDADLVAANVVNGNINGVAIAPVTYGTSHAATMTAVAAAIAAIAGVTRAVVSAARVITVESQGIAITATSWAVTLGVSQATITVGTASSDEVFRGVSLHEHKPAGKYAIKDMVNVGKKGVFWVEVAVAVAIDDTAYVDLGNGIGKFTNVSTNNMTTGGKFRSATTGAGIAKLDINIP